MAGTIRAMLSAAVCVLLVAPCAAAADATLFRLFLTDGVSLVSFGEYARVGDQVVFSMPIGGPAEQPRLHVVSLPASAIDWARTDRYATSARYQQYATTRGEDDFARLTNEVARVLNEIAMTTDRSRALAYAQQARTALAAWPQDHYGYRQEDVHDIVGMLDESISDLRASLGISSFAVALVANPAPIALEPLSGMPTLRQQLDQALRVAGLVERATDRVALLHSALLLLSEAGTAIPTGEATALRRSVEGQIRQEQLVDSRYNMLAQRLIGTAQRAAARASIRDVERVLGTLPREDARLGGQRPDTMTALRVTLQSQLDAARELRLRRDQWTIRRALYRDYQRAVGTQVLQIVKLQPALEAIRRLDGPAPGALIAARSRFAGGAERLSRVPQPQDLRPAHGLLVSAWRFAETALNGRFDAIQSGNMITAQEASSAAAGSLMLLSRAQQEIRQLLELPQLR